MRDFQSRLNTPVAIWEELGGTINYQGISVHPPFKLNQASADIDAFQGVSLPDPGERTLETPGLLEVRPEINPLKGATICHGLRLDVAPGYSIWPQLDYVLGLIRERTHQWWLTTDRNPFDLGIHFYSELDEQRRTLPCYADEERGNAVPWGFSAAYQPRLGLEKSLDQYEWDQCIGAAGRDQRLETATSFFLDALGSYFSSRDETCVYQVCVALEIMESKVRELQNRPTRKYALKLLKSAALWRDEDRALLKKMFVDRGHISHGRAPYHIFKDEDMIKEYIALGERYYRSYLQEINGHDWSSVASL